MQAVFSGGSSSFVVRQIEHIFSERLDDPNFYETIFRPYYQKLPFSSSSKLFQIRSLIWTILHDRWLNNQKSSRLHIFDLNYSDFDLLSINLTVTVLERDIFRGTFFVLRGKALLPKHCFCLFYNIFLHWTEHFYFEKVIKCIRLKATSRCIVSWVLNDVLTVQKLKPK